MLVYPVFATVTVTLTEDLGILQMHPRTKMHFLDQGFQQLEHEHDRHPYDTQTDEIERITTPHSQ